MLMRPWHSSGNNFQIPLTRKEILKINYEIINSFSPKEPVKLLSCKDRFPLPAEELLEISQEISAFYAPKSLTLPTSLVLHAVDPQHIYVLGSFDQYQANDYSQTNATGNELTLKVYSQPVEKNQNVQSKLVFEKSIHTPQFRQKIELPELETTSVYSASLSQTGSNKTDVAFLNSNKTADLHTKKEADLGGKNKTELDAIPFVDSYAPEYNETVWEDIVFVNSDELEYTGELLNQNENLVEKKYSVKSRYTRTQFSGIGKKNSR